MKVICEKNNLNDFKNSEVRNRLKRYIRISDGEVDLRVGREYVVYGIVYRDNYPWYYICEEPHDHYPKPFAADFFRVIDHKYSRFWRPVVEKKRGNHLLSKIVFKDWAKSSSFYERLIDGDSKAIKIFTEYRKLIEEEM